MSYVDPETNERYTPHVVEPSFGCDRLLLALLCDAYDEEQLEKDTRVVLHLSPVIAPYKVAVLPLSKQLAPNAQSEVLDNLVKKYDAIFDVTGSIGKRYRRQDAIGTPFCVTYDFDSLNDHMVTVRERDSMKQERVAIADLAKYIEEKIENR